MTDTEKKVLELLRDADFAERVEEAIREAYALAAESANQESPCPGWDFAVNVYPDGEIVVRAGVLADSHDGKCAVIARARLCVERDEPFEEGYFPEDLVLGDILRDWIGKVSA